ncbi:MAG: nucleotidyltransferase domain-containing protein [Peptococcaceae bacterium]|nr:nucleotidyltransferase domain-containing protein [Peptococcaceae bacterium]
MDRATALSDAAAYAAEVCKVLNPCKIIMYGSYAKGTPSANSDIDIALIFDGYRGNWLKDSALLWKLTRKISTSIEPILLDRAQDPSGFVQEISNTGETLYSDR